MRTVLGMIAFVGLAAACVDTEDPALGAEAQEGSAYRPFGFARVTAAGGLTTSFNSSGGAVTPTRTATGRYTVTFNGLATTTAANGSRGNVQMTATGSGNTRCRLFDWTTAGTTVSVEVQCIASDDTPTDSGFAVMYMRDLWPASPSTWPVRAAYGRVSSNAFFFNSENFNSSGSLNTVTRPATGRYVITIPNATTANASFMVTTVTGVFAGAHVCSMVSWVAPTLTVECRTPSGLAVNNGFTFLYATSGPPSDQQGAHALFNGSVAAASGSAALGKYSWCSAATVTGSRSGSLATLTVAGDLGSWDGSPFLRASFASPSGTIGYCKIESLTSSGTAPSSTSSSTVRCYTPSGATVAVPVFRFTHVTSDPAGPC